MSNFQTYTIDNAPAASKASLEDTKRAFAFVAEPQTNGGVASAAGRLLGAMGPVRRAR